jgi:hypothetical protein
MAAKRAKKKAAAPKKAAPKKKTPTTKPQTKVASAKPPRRLPEIAKRPKRAAKANPLPAIPHEKTLDMTRKPPPPKPKATISRAKAVAIANTFLKENVGKADLYAPRASRFRLGSVVDRGGMINICFCHEADDFDPTIATLGAKCLEALVSAHPQLKAFDIEVQTIRM